MITVKDRHDSPVDTVQWLLDISLNYKSQHRDNDMYFSILPVMNLKIFFNIT